MKNVSLILIVVFSICSMMGASILPSIVATDSQQNIIKTEIGTESHTRIVSNAPYTGRLRVYVVEPVSRWNMMNQEPYHFGFLGFAFNKNISIIIRQIVINFTVSI